MFVQKCWLASTLEKISVGTARLPNKYMQLLNLVDAASRPGISGSPQIMAWTCIQHREFSERQSGLAGHRLFCDRALTVVIGDLCGEVMVLKSEP